MASSASRKRTPAVILDDGITMAPFGKTGGTLALLSDREMQQLDEGTPISESTLSIRDLLMAAVHRVELNRATREVAETYLRVLSGR